PIAIGAALDTRHLRPVFDQARALAAINDLAVQYPEGLQLLPCYLETSVCRFSSEEVSDVRSPLLLPWMMLAKSETSSGSRHPRCTSSSSTANAACGGSAVL